jgi:uncharacterized protein (TIGR00255 family)
MLKSMTAFGRKSLVTELGRFIVEIQSVNRKHLEINIVLPRDFARFEVDLRNWMAKSVLRGQVNVKVTIATTKESPVIISPNLPLVRQYKEAWDKIQDDLSLHFEESSFATLLSKEVGIFINEENINEEEYRESIKSAVDLALEELIRMKLHEGMALQNDISSRVNNLKRWIAEISLKAPGATQKYRQRLLERLKEFLEMTASEVDERILKEIAIYAEKIDITEEIIRFQSHLDQFEKLMESGSESIGKTLEFLIQELHREINTIASKSSDLEVSRLVIDCKSELERMREQIQNVE